MQQAATKDARHLEVLGGAPRRRCIVGLAGSASLDSLLLALAGSMLS